MTNTDTSKPITKTALTKVLLNTVLAATSGAACALAVIPRSTAPASPKTGPLGSGIIAYEGPWSPSYPAIGDNPAAPVGSPGPEPGQYMLVTCLSIVGLLSWRISRARIGASSDVDILGPVTDTQQGGRFPSDTQLRAR